MYIDICENQLISLRYVWKYELIFPIQFSFPSWSNFTTLLHPVPNGPNPKWGTGISAKPKKKKRKRKACIVVHLFLTKFNNKPSIFSDMHFPSYKSFHSNKKMSKSKEKITHYIPPKIGVKPIPQKFEEPNSKWCTRGNMSRTSGKWGHKFNLFVFELLRRRKIRKTTSHQWPGLQKKKKKGLPPTEKVCRDSPVTLRSLEGKIGA